MMESYIQAGKIVSDRQAATIKKIVDDLKKVSIE